MKMDVASMTLLENGDGTDLLYLELAEEDAKRIRGKFFPVFEGLYAKVEITCGQGRLAVEQFRELFGPCPATAINMKTGEKTEI